MKTYNHLLYSLPTVVLLFGMGMFSNADAGFPDSTPIQSTPDAQMLLSEMASTTNRIIVKHRQADTGRATISAITQQVTQTTGHIMTHIGTMGTGAHVVKLDEMISIDDAREIAREIESNPAIEYAEPDKRVLPLYTPNDPRYNEQWHYFDETEGVSLPEAWDITRGEDVIIAVIDSGYTEHVDLLDNLQLPGIDLILDTTISKDGDGRDLDAHDPGDWSADCGWFESSWHGTHTAGTAAAVGDNGIGVTGVAFNARILPVRVLGSCGGWLSDVADGIIWSAGGQLAGLPVNETPAQVINLSTGGNSDGCSQFMQDAINTALQLGSTIIAAAGNYNTDVSGQEPANCNGVISVAATNTSGSRASFSNYGDLVDIAAPGVRVLSTMNAGTTTPEGDTYEYYQGTSMAAPQVSGVAALLYSIRPDITPSEVEQILKETAKPFPGDCVGCGAGLLDAAAAVAAVIGEGPDPQPDWVVLENGVRQDDISSQGGDSVLYAIDVPENARNLEILISGGSGDADLYVQFESVPTLEIYDCRPYRNGNSESCQIANPQAGRYFALIYGYASFAGLSITAAYETVPDDPPEPVVHHFENSEDYSIPNFSFSGTDSPIEVPLDIESGTIDVHIDIKHPAMQEVYIKLIAPNSDSFWLWLGGEGGVAGANLDQTFTIDMAGSQASGRWLLKVFDLGFSGQGHIDSWSMTFVE